MLMCCFQSSDPEGGEKGLTLKENRIIETADAIIRTAKKQTGDDFHNKEQVLIEKSLITHFTLGSRQSSQSQEFVSKTPDLPEIDPIGKASSSSAAKSSPSLKSTQSWTWRGLQPARRSWGRRGSSTM